MFSSARISNGSTKTSDDVLNLSLITLLATWILVMRFAKGASTPLVKGAIKTRPAKFVYSSALVGVAGLGIL